MPNERKNKLIVETLFEPSVITEVETNGVKQYIISGKFTVVDKPNGNNRIYPREVMQKAIEKLRIAVNKKCVRMSLDHPYSEGRLADAAAILLELSDIDTNGFGWYKAQLLPNDEQSQKIKNIIDCSSPVGVSTRGYGDALYDQEWPGLPGKYVVIRDGFELETVDFVDTPSVSETMDDITVECKKRSSSNMKTLEELRKENPEVFAALDKTHAEALDALNKKIVVVTTEKEAVMKNFNALVDSIKAMKPEAFTTIPETETIKQSKESIEKLNKTIESLNVEKETLTKKVSMMEAETIKLEREKKLESLKAADPEFFKIPAAASRFESCITAAEVQTVYESNSALVKSLKESMGETTVKPPKTNTDKTSDGTKLTDSQKKQFEAINIERMSQGLAILNETQFIEKYK